MYLNKPDKNNEVNVSYSVTKVFTILFYVTSLLFIVAVVTNNIYLNVGIILFISIQILLVMIAKSNMRKALRKIQDNSMVVCAANVNHYMNKFSKLFIRADDMIVDEYQF